MRILTIACCLLGALVTAIVAVSTLGRIAEPATHSLDMAAGYAMLALFVLTTVPAAWLTLRARSPRLALAFPGVFALLFLAAAVAFA